MLTQVYCAQKTIDERGTRGAVVGYYRSEIAAKVAAEKQGWYGGDGQVSRCWVITVAGRFYPIEQYQEKGVPVDLLDKNIPLELKRRREVAWVKVTEALSPDERDLLGITEPQA
ncbi:hypothetical protein KABACHOK_03400 [Brevundimonas phage vB_BpoS-Kabachok]|uniref:Uncharacterized protein n=1 Tax=Brevundimonas phage vB_BpoS-Kabachok TaxID=2948600 RepID=A0A9E7MNY5_9CAUD|nr:hypothetical protein KABACHOK_03400 [Brevundimonas phage vB_BpoS-Kabachok]